jgi:hypothetical protein
MTQDDRNFLYQTLNDCTRVLNEELSTGQSCVYVTIDRAKYNSLLKEIAEAKRTLVRPSVEKVTREL